jgi:hypothetical protein
MAREHGVSESVMDLPDEWQRFARKNLVAGYGSAPRVTKKLVETGATPEQASELIDAICVERRASNRRNAILCWVLGGLSLPATVGILVATDRLFYYIPVVGFLTIARGLSFWKYAREFEKRDEPAADPLRRRRRPIRST